MKLALVTIAALLSLTGAAGRVLWDGDGHQGQGQGGQGLHIIAKLQEMVESECTSDFACPESITDCANIEKPEKPTDWWNMSDGEKANAKAEMEATKDTFKQQVLVCACCEGKTVQELVGYDEDGSESSLDEDGSDSSSSQDGGTTDINTEDTEDLLSSLPENAVAVAKASATVNDSELQNAFLSNPAAGHASLSWVLTIAAFGMVGLAL
jgi:hypothetical protein